jgi:hypothetical protein
LRSAIFLWFHRLNFSRSGGKMAWKRLKSTWKFSLQHSNKAESLFLTQQTYKIMLSCFVLLALQISVCVYLCGDLPSNSLRKAARQRMKESPTHCRECVDVT